jgi:hypothetical protein
MVASGSAVFVAFVGVLAVIILGVFFLFNLFRKKRFIGPEIESSPGTFEAILVVLGWPAACWGIAVNFLPNIWSTLMDPLGVYVADWICKSLSLTDSLFQRHPPKILVISGHLPLTFLALYFVYSRLSNTRGNR